MVISKETKPVVNPNFKNKTNLGMGRREGGEIYVFLWLIHNVMQQKPAQHCKAIILQLKINFKKRTK